MVILICGTICAGKTAYAGRLLDRRKARLLSADEAVYVRKKADPAAAHDALLQRVKRDLLEKAAELARGGTDVILDWGFWTKAEREKISAFFAHRGIPHEWHYVHADPKTIERNIADRNTSKADYEFYADEGLRKKVNGLFEPPDPSEVNVWIENRRE